MKRPRGRPKSDVPPVKSKNITVDPDSLILLQTAQEQMETELGFRPTLAQTLRRLISLYTEVKR